MSHWPSQREKTLRAFRAYLDLIDTADWLKNELRGQLESFDLTMPGFRLLEMLYREGALPVPNIARRRLCTRQNVGFILDSLEARGWVGHRVVNLPAVEVNESRIAKARRGARQGPRVRVVALTKSGKEFIGTVLPRHVKRVKALMRALDGREQESISAVCRKLREGDIFKFLREMQMMDEEGEAEQLRERAMADLERHLRRTRLRRIAES
ncbi:MAG TPA: MarR family transcriptional regulator [Candidatus Aquilonibacter sp.]|nr:MarR family transcriptional regulator [Candidatus Aquilonibacter sp.]